MSVERFSFPEEPLRRVSQEPKPAIVNQDGQRGIEFAQEKDGQLYLWEGVTSFPDSWSMPNKQVPLFPNLHVPIPDSKIEPLRVPEPITQQDKQIPFWPELAIPENWVALNQEWWRDAKRGKLSRPLELKSWSGILHERLVRTFGLESEGTQKPILTWSVILDSPKTPSSRFVYAERYPEEIAEEDRENFSIGISRINEYATNYATKEFFKRNADFPIGRQIATAYGAISDIFTYALVLNGTYQRMRDIEIMANHNGLDYKGALLQALFQHDNGPLNDIIAMTKEYTGYSDINGLAIEIGKKRQKKPDIGKWLDKLDADRTDSKAKAAMKNGAISTVAFGVFRNPGVIESSIAILPASPLIAVIGNYIVAEACVLANFRLGALTHPQQLEWILPGVIDMSVQSAALMAGVAAFVWSFIATHEDTHSISSDERFMGLIPAKLIEREVTPYKARLEKEE